MKITYRISQLVPYINWVYYFYAWQVKDEAEKQRMQREALAKLEKLEGNYQVHAVFELFDAYSDDDDIVIFRTQMCPDCGVKHPVRVASILTTSFLILFISLLFRYNILQISCQSLANYKIKGKFISIKMKHTTHIIGDA